MIAKALGANVIGVDIVPDRLKLAQGLGADQVIDPNKGNLVRQHNVNHGRARCRCSN